MIDFKINIYLMANIGEIKKTITNKSINLFNYVNNFERDIHNMIIISKQISTWIDNGIDISTCIDPLNIQIELWKTKMNLLFNEFKNNIIELKNVDDRIININNIAHDLDNITENKLEDWRKIIDIYNNLFNTLEEDVSMLYDISNNLNQYSALGVKLGGAIDSINEQVESILFSITKSSDNLDSIILQIENECGKVDVSTTSGKVDVSTTSGKVDVSTTSGKVDTGVIIRSSHIEEYSGGKKEVNFDHSVIQNNESAFEIHLKFLSNTYTGNPVMLGGGDSGNRIFFGWQVNGGGQLYAGLGGSGINSLNDYSKLAGTIMEMKFIQYGDKTGRFVVNGIEEDLIDIPNYTYTSTNIFYYNGHYNDFPSHNGTVYEYKLYS
jgi:hypothetical protein